MATRYRACAQELLEGLCRQEEHGGWSHRQHQHGAGQQQKPSCCIGEIRGTVRRKKIKTRRQLLQEEERKNRPNTVSV